MFDVWRLSHVSMYLISNISKVLMHFDLHNMLDVHSFYSSGTPWCLTCFMFSWCVMSWNQRFKILQLRGQIFTPIWFFIFHFLFFKKICSFRWLIYENEKKNTQFQRWKVVEFEKLWCMMSIVCLTKKKWRGTKYVGCINRHYIHWSAF